jgi:hypothetical protein
MRIAFSFAALVVVLLTSLQARALDAYPAEVTNQFVAWCTGTQDQPETVCTCAVNKAALEIPAAAMASFLSAAEDGGVASVSSGVGATSLQIITVCVTSSSPTGGTMLKSLGGALSQ